jgi:HSP20 family protein
MSEDRRKNLRDVIDELDRYFEQVEKEIQEAVKKSISSPRFQEPFVTGFSFRLGPEGKPSVQVFGDKLLQEDGDRSPMSEQLVDQAKGILRVVLEMPGVEKEDIKVDAAEGRVVVTAEREERKYKADIALGTPVNPEGAKAEYRNGILEISFPLRDKPNKAFRRVDIV